MPAILAENALFLPFLYANITDEREEEKTGMRLRKWMEEVGFVNKNPDPQHTVYIPR